MPVNILRLWYEGDYSDDSNDVFEVEIQVTNGELDFSGPKNFVIKNNIMNVENYSGKILLPKNIALDIPETYSVVNVSGSLASPACFPMNGDINLYIPSDSGLDLICQMRHESSVLRFNNLLKRESYINTYGNDFEYLRDAMYQDLSRGISGPNVSRNIEGIDAEFTNKLNSIDDIDVCIFNKIIFVSNNGVANIYFPSKPIPQRFKVSDYEQKKVREIKDYFIPETFNGPHGELKTPPPYKMREKKVRVPKFTDVFPQSKFYP